MKAKSLPFDSIQRPATVFGLPPKLMGAAVFLAIALFVILTQIGAPITLITFTLFISLPTGAFWSWRLRANDHHVESVYPATRAFWRGRGRRVFLAGVPTSTVPRLCGRLLSGSAS